MSIHEPDVESPLSPAQVETDIEQQVIAGIHATLLARKSLVTNKDIILELLVRLETETDSEQLDVYRDALQRVVRATPDDL